MKDKTAVFLLLAVCVIEAFLLLAGVISPLTGGGIFAAALVFFGGFTLAHRRRRRLTEHERDS